MWYMPTIRSIATILARNPIHSILGVRLTFIASAAVVMHYVSLGFTCSLILIVYIGAIAIRFLFIVMMIPIKTNYYDYDHKSHWLNFFKNIVFPTIVLTVVWLGAKEHFASGGHERLGELWLSVANQTDFQSMFPLLPTDEVEGVATSDLKSDDIKLYGSKLYKENSFALIMTCTLLFTVLAAAIILCMDE